MDGLVLAGVRRVVEECSGGATGGHDAHLVLLIRLHGVDELLADDRRVAKVVEDDVKVGAVVPVELHRVGPCSSIRASSIMLRISLRGDGRSTRSSQPSDLDTGPVRLRACWLLQSLTAFGTWHDAHFSNAERTARGAELSSCGCTGGAWNANRLDPQRKPMNIYVKGFTELGVRGCVPCRSLRQLPSCGATWRAAPASARKPGYVVGPFIVESHEPVAPRNCAEFVAITAPSSSMMKLARGRSRSRRCRQACRSPTTMSAPAMPRN